MPRLGINPARGHVSDYHPSRVTLCMLTYLPELYGYFRERFDVIRLSLESLVAHTTATDLMVFDNGSCEMLVNYLRGLRDAGKIKYLFLSSENIGKIGAFQVMFPAVPGELIAYADDDMFFLPGWLDACLKIMDTYPKVGMVSGFYVRSQMKYGIDSTLEFVGQPDVNSRTGLIWPREYEEHYLDGYGWDADKYAKEIEGIEDHLLTYHDVDALVSAQHMQFVAPKQVLLDALPKTWSGHLMGQMRELDMAVDRLGYFRLSTPEPVTRFLGNVVSPEIANLAQQYGLSVDGKVVLKPRHPLRFLLRSGRVNLWLWKFYNNLFDLLNSREAK